MKKYSDETRAAVMAALLAGQSVNAAAREYNIPPGTISHWKNKAPDLQNALNDQGAAIGELLLSYLRENLATLRAQAVVFRNEQWLIRQNASDVAVLHGVLTDKAIRLIEAMRGEL
jgi:transposase-like protein